MNLLRFLLVGFLFVGFLPDLFAGNLWVTGHDADLHCGEQGSQCNHFGVAIDFARQGAPDPTKPLLFIGADNGWATICTDDPGDNGHCLVAAERRSAARDKNTVEGAGNAFAYEFFDLDSQDFNDADLSVNSYSAIVISSDHKCSGCELNTGTDTNNSDEINLRQSDILAFFNQGGGVVFFSGAATETNDHSVIYYQSSPIAVIPLLVNPPFTLTADGTRIGLVAPGDNNCCATHNDFDDPTTGNELVVAERSFVGNPETMFNENPNTSFGWTHRP